MKTTTSLALILSLVGTMSLAAGPDADGDSVPDTAEPLLHTDPGNADTDGDGQNDLADAAPVTAPDPTISGGLRRRFILARRWSRTTSIPLPRPMPPTTWNCSW